MHPGLTMLPPPMWQAAQLAPKILAPSATSAAITGRLKMKVVIVKARKIIESSFFMFFLVHQYSLKK